MVDRVLENRHNHFDTLRFVAAFFVILTHAYAFLGLPEHDLLYRVSNHTASWSRLGVWIFFILSGYLVTQSALRSKTIQGYVWKRALRILPAFWCVVLVSVFVLGPIVTTLPLRDYFSSGAFTYLKTLAVFRIQFTLPGVFETNLYPDAVNGSLWTIPYEVFLYSIPALFWFFRKKIAEVRWGIFAIWAGLSLSYSWWASALFSTTVPLFFLRANYLVDFGCFFLGGALLRLFHDRIQWSQKHLILVSTFLIGGCIAGVGHSMSFITLPYIVIYLGRLPHHQPMIAFLGMVSYGMYLYAFPVGQVVSLLFGGVITSPFLLSLCIVSPTLFFATLSWYGIEQIALRYKYFIA